MTHDNFISSLPMACPSCKALKRTVHIGDGFTMASYTCGRATRENADNPGKYEIICLCKGRPLEDN